MDRKSPEIPVKMEAKDTKVSGGPIITLIGTVIVGCMGLAASVLLANTRNYLKPKGKLKSYAGIKFSCHLYLNP